MVRRMRRKLQCRRFPGFAMLGHIEALSVDNAADPLSAGRLTINGIPVRLPRNLFITMPGQYLTPAEGDAAIATHAAAADPHPQYINAVELAAAFAGQRGRSYFYGQL